MRVYFLIKISTDLSILKFNINSIKNHILKMLSDLNNFFILRLIHIYILEYNDLCF